MRALLLLGLALALAAGEAAGPVVVLTAFQPFAGRGSNGSATVARALEAAGVPGAELHVVVMPVRWGEPLRTVPALVERWRPSLLLGLGEGLPGRIAVERRADNRRLAVPDEDGRAAPDPSIEAGMRPPRPFRLRVDPAWFAGSGSPLAMSDDAGGYLCNEAMWAILGTTVPAAGFIHLPPQADEPEAAYRARLVPAIRAVIAGNLPR